MPEGPDQHAAGTNTQSTATGPDQAEIERDLEIGRDLARSGIALFVARPDPESSTGFALPRGWQHIEADPAVVDRWQPGDALCAVMGVRTGPLGVPAGLDLLDVDPRNGGAESAGGQMNGSTPRSYGVAETPSGGMHSFIAPLGTGSRDGIYPGIDVKSGTPEGTGRGFAFLPPTVKTSKVTGEPVPYRWLHPPGSEGVAALSEVGGDHSGAGLAARVRAVRTADGVAPVVEGEDWWRAFVLNDKEPQSEAAALRAIGEKLDEITAWDTHAGQGFRTVLMRAALTCGGYVGGGWLDEHTARSWLENATDEVWGSADQDDLLWISQGLADGMLRPFYVYTPADEAIYGEAAQRVAAAGQFRASGERPWSVYTALGPDPFDPVGVTLDQEMAEAVIARVVPVLRYAADAGTWVVHDGDQWRERGSDLSGWACTTAARMMPLGQTPVPPVEDRTEAHWQAVRRTNLLSSAGASKVERKIRTVVQAGRHPGSIELANLDTEPEVLWAGGVPWDLRASGEVPMRSPLADDTPHLHTARTFPVAMDTPAWDRFAAAVFPDPELRGWALRVLSVAFAGYPDAVLPVLFGPSRTGKTSIVQLLVDVLGTYGHSADPRLLGAADQAHASVVYALRGRRLSFIDEGPRRGHLATERLKQLTGGGSLTGNAMRQNPITFSPTHTLVMTTNEEPPITDPALRNRIRLLPCDADAREVETARRAITPAVWELEAPGVLAMMMREAAAWLGDRSSASVERSPESIRSILSEMVTAQDPVTEWVADMCVPDEVGTAGRTLYHAFAEWHESKPAYRRIPVPSETMFGSRLTDLGYPWRMGGARGNVRVRPLRVTNGGPGAGIMPVSAPNGGLAAIGMDDPVPMVVPTVAEGGGAKPSASENASSTTVSVVPAEGTDTQTGTTENTTHTVTHIEHTPLATQRKMGGNHRPLGTVDLPAPDSRSTGPADPSAESPADPSAPSVGTAAEPVQPAIMGMESETPITDTGTNWSEVTKSEMTRLVAERATRTGETKTDARKALTAERKAAERQGAIEQAGGEMVGLPAVVDRNGTVLGVTETEAEQLITAAVRRSGALTVDVETSGYPVGHPRHALRSVQLGDSVACVVLDPARHGELARSALADAPALHAHSAGADLVPLAHAGIVADAEDAWDRMHDTVIPAKLTDPKITGADPSLKVISPTVLGERAVSPSADEGRKALFAAGKWLTEVKPTTPHERNGWSQVPSGCATMIRYAGSDVLDTAALPGALPRIDPQVYDRERLAERMTARVGHQGVRLDGERVRRLTVTHGEARRAIGAQLTERFGIENPGSPAQVGDILTRLGAALPVTKNGNPSAAEGVITPFRTVDGPVGEFVSSVLDWRHHDTIGKLFLAPYAELLSGDGRARPTVYTLSADTGRMSCVEASALVEMPRDLSKYPGGVPITEVKAGDWVYAFDHHRELVLRRVKWCAQTAVRQTMIITSEPGDGHQITLRATPEHLIRLRNGDWRATENLVHQVGRPHRDDGPRLMTMVKRHVGEATQGYSLFFPHSVARLGAGTKGGGRSREHRWIVEKTTGKRLSTKVDVNHIDGNRLNNHPDNLQAMGMCEHRGNRDLAWGTTQPEVELYDGPTDYRVVSVEPGPVEPVWDMEVEEVHNFIANGICVHNCVRPNLQQLPREGGVRACILADDGERGISADFSSVELRVAAALSGDPTLRAFIAEGRDLHAEIARQVWGESAGKAERYIAKRIVFGRLYGGGIPTLAAQAGVGQHIVSSAIDVLDEMTPVLAQWSHRMRQAVKGGNTAFVTYSGRTVHLPREYPHKAPNYAIQGTSREALLDTLVRWDQTKWGKCRLMPVHDELIVFVPEEDAEEATRTLVECMTTEINGVPITAKPDTPWQAWPDAN